MSRRPTIWVDADGVLFDLNAAFLGVVEDITGRRHEVAEVVTWQYRDCILSVEEEKACWARVLSTQGFVEGLPSLPFMQYLPALREFADVKCLTTPSFGPYWMYERMKALIERAGFRKEDIHQSGDKTAYGAHGDVLVDDAIHNCVAFREGAKRRSGWCPPLGETLLISQPYNSTPPEWLAPKRMLPQAAFASLVSSFKGAT